MEYYLHHYADEKPYKITIEKIIIFAQDDGYEGNDLEEAINFLHDIGNVHIFQKEDDVCVDCSYDYDEDAVDSFDEVDKYEF